MSITPLQVLHKCKRDQYAEIISSNWTNWNNQRRNKISEWQELRNYLFATDTTTTSNAALPWKNKTTLPKLCQIRDNLHSNYLSALFPNDDWLKWESYSQEDNTKQKRSAIQAYMENKCRIGGFRQTMSQALLDFIDYGMCFGTVDFENSYRENAYGEQIINFIGPKARRISPYDIVFNPLATTFQESPKIVRSLVSLGELRAMGDDQPDNAYLQNALKRRDKLLARPGAFGMDENFKWEGFQMDGFGSYLEYLQCGYVEMLTFYGDIHNSETNEFLRAQKIVVIDRMWVVEMGDIPQWMGTSPIFAVGWRTRPDNLWAMGPLDNLVGMQYRIDHLENLKADAMDLAVLPPLVIVGDVEPFDYAPGAEIHIDSGDGAGVTELARNAQWVIQADNAISLLEQRMEMYAGAPREAMGIRTAGEKTAFEVQQLQNAAGRIFQEKITSFEIQFMEPLLNAMLETSARNMDIADTIRVMDNDIGAQIFMEVTKEDIVANGVLRPVGARHFAAQAQLLQNLTGVFNTNMGQIITPHVSAIKLATLIEDILGVGRYELVRPNVAVFEQQETMRLANQAEEDLEVEASAPVLGA